MRHVLSTARTCVAAAALVTAAAAGAAPAHATSSGEPPAESAVTLAGGQDVTSCISALPKPGCTTRRDTDAMQVAVLAVMVGGLGFVGWRTTRSVRRRDDRPST